MRREYREESQCPKAAGGSSDQLLADLQRVRARSSSLAAISRNSGASIGPSSSSATSNVMVSPFFSATAFHREVRLPNKGFSGELTGCLMSRPLCAETARPFLKA